MVKMGSCQPRWHKRTDGGAIAIARELGQPEAPAVWRSPHRTAGEEESRMRWPRLKTNPVAGYMNVQQRTRSSRLGT